MDTIPASFELPLAVFRFLLQFVMFRWCRIAFLSLSLRDGWTIDKLGIQMWSMTWSQNSLSWLATSCSYKASDTPWQHTL